MLIFSSKSMPSMFLLSHVRRTLFDHMDCRPLGSPVHGTVRARILKWVAISFSRGSSQPRDRSWVSCNSVQSVQLLSHVQLFVTPWTAAHWGSLSITNSWSLLKLMSIESVMPSNHLTLCRPLLLLPVVVIQGIQIKTGSHSVSLPNWQKLKRFTIFNIGKCKGKLAVSSTGGENENWYSLFKGQFGSISHYLKYDDPFIQQFHFQKSMLFKYVHLKAKTEGCTLQQCLWQWRKH